MINTFDLFWGEMSKIDCPHEAAILKVQSENSLFETLSFSNEYENKSDEMNSYRK